ncbi:MAG: sulfurtransferase TusA family protein [Prevotella sp.]|jgi:sulfite reductase (ferredoxin)|nr:sulfurtransferase TusA family protein [Prevotella sp.]
MYKLPDSLKDDIAKLTVLSKDYQSKKIEAVQFKAFRVPMGIYEQRKDEVYMARIRTTGGVIYPEQFLKVLDIAQSHRSDLLHITTRQEIQIQNLELNEVEPILLELQEIGLSTKGGGGNTVRNIIVSHNSGISDTEVFDTTPYAMQLTTKLIAEADSYLLPRKMKIAFSSDDKQIDYAAVNDLGFVAQLKNGEKGFRVYAGGGGGSKPTVGWLLFDFIPAKELYVAAEALKKFFSEHGNRKNKHKARLRYIFYKLGEVETLRLIKDYYNEAKKTTPDFILNETENERPNINYTAKAATADSGYEKWQKRYVYAQKQAGYNSILVPVNLGNIHLNDEHLVSGVQQLLRFISQFGKHTIRFTTTQNIRLRNIPTPALPDLYQLLNTFLPDINMPTIANNIVACTGADTCRLGIGLSKGLAASIRRKLAGSALDLDKLASARIHISGCPNSCGQQTWADIGFSGKILRNNRIYPGYQVYLAANRDETPRLATPAGNISARDVPDFVVELLQSYLDEAAKYNSLTAYLETDGKEKALQLIEKYKDIPDFEDDKNYYFDWGAETIFSIVDRGTAECSAGLFDMIEVDLNIINTNREALQAVLSKEKANELLYDIVYSSARMLLVTRGAEPKTVEDTFNLFIKNFIKFGFVEDKYQSLIELARDNRNADFSQRKEEIYALAEAVSELYRNMDDSLQFKNVKANSPVEQKEEAKPAQNDSHSSNERKFKDLRGVACPMNFVQTKIMLSPMKSGEILEIWLDDGQPIANVPGSVRGEGHEVLEQTAVGDYWKVVIKKK